MINQRFTQHLAPLGYSIPRQGPNEHFNGIKEISSLVYGGNEYDTGLLFEFNFHSVNQKEEVRCYQWEQDVYGGANVVKKWDNEIDAYNYPQYNPYKDHHFQDGPHYGGRINGDYFHANIFFVGSMSGDILSLTYGWKYINNTLYLEYIQTKHY